MGMISALGNLRSMWRKSRRSRIIVSAALIGVFSGISGLGLPVEDALTNLRTNLRYDVADDSIVVVEIDDKTLDVYQAEDAPRSQDAVLIENLVAAGAKLVAFDRSYDFLEDPKQDRILADKLKEHPGKVFMGAIYAQRGRDKRNTFLPAPIFREHVGVVSLVGFIHPFRLSASFPFKTDTEMGTVPSMSAKLAGLEELPDGMFRPDFAIDTDTVPRYSYIDVVDGKVPAEKLRGRSIIVATTAFAFHDFHPMPSQGYVPGAYFHVVAAHTLKNGMPIDLGWLAAFLPVLALIVSGIGQGRPVDRYRIAGIVAIVVFVPYLLDGFSIKMDVFPAAITAGIAIFRARTLDQVEAAGQVNPGSGLPSLPALQVYKEGAGEILIALKIRNYGAITGSFAQPVEASLANEIVRRIRISEPRAVVHHEGDMFLWFTSLANPLDVFENLEGLHLIMQNGLTIEGRDVDLSFNCGVDSDFASSVATRISNARQCAEEAVRRDELVWHDDGAGRENTWQISLLSSLDRAIDNGEVWVAYQPKLDLESGEITGAEALVRWEHPERGAIPPDQFIKIAEEYHRIERITRFVLEDAVRSAARLMRQGRKFTVSVNISAQLLRNPGLPDMIFDILRAHKLPPERLILEITETDRLDRSAKTVEMMKRLVEAGLKLSIDDFGTGNATIDYLRYLPAGEVKIDMVFVKAMQSSREDLLLVQSIIDMAHTLDRKVVAEGVETDESIDALRKMGCDEVQGYRISRPVAFAELLELLARSKGVASG